MKALVFSNLVPDKAGGFEHFIAALGAGLKARGDGLVAVFAGEPAGEVASRLRSAGISWHVIPGWTDPGDRVRPWRFVMPAVAIVRRERPDVVAVNFGNELPSVVAALLAGSGRTACRAKWVWQQHQRMVPPHGLNSFVSRMKLVGAVFDRVVVLYEGGRRPVERRGVPARKVDVICNGIAEPVRIREAGWLRRQLGLGPEDILAVTVGSLIPRKRIGFQLEALAEAETGIHLAVCGGGPDLTSLRDLSERLGIGRRVHWLGRRNDISDVLAEADLLLHSALAEASPYAVLEAMAAGLPVLATASGAIPEQVENGRTGLVVSESDRRGFVSSLRDLSLDKELRSTMGCLGRKRWEENFTEKRCVERYMGLYADLAEHGKRRP